MNIIDKMYNWIRAYVNNEGYMSLEDQCDAVDLVKNYEEAVYVYIWYKPFLSKHIIGGVCMSEHAAVEELKDFIKRQEESFHYTISIADYTDFVEKFKLNKE